MRKALHYTFLLFAIVLVLVSSCGPKKEINFDDVTTEPPPPDSLFTLYADSLNKYFGPLEQDLIRKYKENHKNLQTEQDFYNFYRRTHTLKINLKKTLQAHIKELQQRGVMAEDMPNFAWFKELARGLEVADVHHHTTCDIFYDYNILLKYAQNTEGNADDEYTKLIRVCFDDDRYFPVWIQTFEDNDDLGCSLLGSGKHYIAIEQLIKAQEAGELFKRELAKIKSLVYKDIIFRKEYCLSAKEAISELKLIMKKLDIKDSDKVLFEARIKQFQEADKYKLQFNCSDGNCIHDPTIIPDL